jgi:hypothetical protein
VNFPREIEPFGVGRIDQGDFLFAPPFLELLLTRIHKTLRITPAVAAGVSDHVWSMDEIAEAGKPVAPAKRGPYKKKEAA